MKSIRYCLAAIALGSALAGAPASAQDDGWHWRWLGGVWQVKVAPKDCTTGNTLPVPPFLSLFTMHADGTLAASLQNYAVSGTNRSLSHGLWKQVPGKRSEYVLKFLHVKYDFATGVFTGTQQADSQVTLSLSGDSFTGSSRNRGFDANGNEISGGCANLTGERMQIP